MRVCELCGKGTTVGVDSTHNYGGGWARRAQRTRKVWKANLRTAKVKTDSGVTKKLTVCMKCYKGLRSGKFKDLKLAYSRPETPAK
jgi:ribosomal protein L28